MVLCVVTGRSGYEGKFLYHSTWEESELPVISFGFLQFGSGQSRPINLDLFSVNLQSSVRDQAYLTSFISNMLFANSSNQ